MISYFVTFKIWISDGFLWHDLYDFNDFQDWANFSIELKQGNLSKLPVGITGFQIAQFCRTTNEFEIVFDKIKKNKLPECFSNWYLGNVHCDNRNGWVSLSNFELFLRFEYQFLFTLRPLSRLTVINGEIGYLFQLFKFKSSKVKNLRGKYTCYI